MWNRSTLQRDTVLHSGIAGRQMSVEAQQQQQQQQQPQQQEEEQKEQQQQQKGWTFAFEELHHLYCYQHCWFAKNV